MGRQNERTGSQGCAPQGSFFVAQSQYVFFLLRFSAMDLLKACDDEGLHRNRTEVDRCLGGRSRQLLQLEEGLTALKAALEM